MDGKPSLADPYLKISRAKEHLEVFRSEHSKFTRSDPYRLVPEEDAERQLYKVTLVIDETPPPVSLILGELLYCLRSSLDQLIWSLASLTVRYPEGTQFPILDVDITKDRDAKGRFDRQTKGVPSAAITIIESLQPYRGGDGAALGLLNSLGNIDKHRRLALHGSFVKTRRFVPAELILSFGFENNNPFVLVPLEHKSKVNLKPQAAFRVFFGDPHEGIQCDFRDIENIYRVVSKEVIPRFASFF